MPDRVRHDGDVYVGCLRASGCVIPALSRYPEPRSYRRGALVRLELGGIGCRIRSGMTGLRIFEALRVISSQTTKLDAHIAVCE